ncbi:SHOCT domain-containing protein [Candidatus Pelagibacter sp.]|nr:SHOCT domain-containing protein [Candidatus Pelagibacter sp.]|tara:strand:+ start:1762 stop:2040 length:279 start_codon:yes stop_codon:yes gene_type:complete
MMTYLVVGICLFLLIIVIYISAKPISMGIEARRNIKDNTENDEFNTQNITESNEEVLKKQSLSSEIMKLNDLKNKGILTKEEYEKAKDKLLN